MCIIDKIANLTIMVARFSFYFDKMGKMTKKGITKISPQRLLGAIFYCGGHFQKCLF